SGHGPRLTTETTVGDTLWPARSIQGEAAMTSDRHYRLPTVLKDEDDSRPSNLSSGASFSELANTRFSRRAALTGLLATTALTAVGGLAARKAEASTAASSLQFAEIPHAMDEKLHVAEGYDAQILLRWGDKVAGDAPAFDPKAQSADAQAKQFGYNNDFV